MVYSSRNRVKNQLLAISLTLLALTTFFSVVDVTSDFAQGVLLYQVPELRVYGIVTISLNWVPGIVASIELLSNHRNEIGLARTIIACGDISFLKQNF